MPLQLPLVINSSSSSSLQRGQRKPKGGYACPGIRFYRFISAVSSSDNAPLSLAQAKRRNWRNVQPLRPRSHTGRGRSVDCDSPRTPKSVILSQYASQFFLSLPHDEQDSKSIILPVAGNIACSYNFCIIGYAVQLMRLEHPVCSPTGICLFLFTRCLSDVGRPFPKRTR